MKQLDLYDIQINMEDNETGMFLVSLVEDPAMEIDWLMFSKNKPMKFNVDQSKHIITGVAIRADVPIYRYTNGIEYYVRFKKQDIPQIVQKFMQNGFSNLINIQHNENTLSMNDAVMVESFFINKERGICPVEFENIEDGSWCTSYKILNDELWNQIIAGNLKGFSIEIAANLVPTETHVQLSKDIEKSEDEELIEMFELEKVTPINTDTITVDIADIAKQNIDLNTFTTESVEFAMEKHYPVMLTYDNNEATGFRQGAISAYGYTSSGNKALRFHEYYGVSASNTMGWKIILWDHVQEFKVIDYLGTWTANEIGYTGEMGLDGPGYLQNAHTAPMW